MTDKKISDLTAITGASTASDDLFVMVDSSEGVTKKITRAELNNALERDTFATVDIDSGTIDGTTIGGSTPASGTFTTGQFNTSLNVDGTVTADGLTVDGDVLITTNTATNPFVISRLGSTNESLQVTLDDGVVNFKSEQDEAGRYGGFAFIGRNNGTDANRLKIEHTSGDISFYEDTGTTAKFFWDASAESLGLGTTLPAVNLHIVDADNNAQIRVENNDGLAKFQKLDDDLIVTNTDTGDIIVKIGTGETERLRVDNSGRVGIGTTAMGSMNSYGSGLTVGNSGISGSAGMTVYASANTGYSSVYFGDPDDTKVGWFEYNHNTDSLAIGAGNAEAARVTSAGLIGIGTSVPKTELNISANNSGQGAKLTIENSDTSITTGDILGQIDFYANDASTNGTGAKANIRSVVESSAGTLVGLAFGTSDSTSATAVEAMRITSGGLVGIGTSIPDNALTVNGSSKVYSTTVGNSITHSVTSTSAYAQTITLDNFGLSFDNNSNSRGYRFSNNGSERMRILSTGGITFNGDTSTANALDDYEEGTWTPTLDNVAGDLSATSLSFNASGRYTKIGRVVYITGVVSSSGTVTGTAASPVKITGLPFTVGGISAFGGAFVDDSPSYNKPSVRTTSGEFDGGNTIIALKKDGTTHEANFLTSDLSASGNANRIYVSGFYTV